MKITTLILTVLFVANSLFANSISNVKTSSSFTEIVTDPIMPSLSNLYFCGYDNGNTSFNLTVQTPIILAAQSGVASNYSVSYHLTLTDANFGSNALNSSSYYNMTNPQTIYVRVVNSSTSQFAVGSFNLIVNTPVIPIFPTINSICQGSIPPILPTVSTNPPSILGTWSPSTIDSTVSGTSTYTFTPDYGQCASSTTMNINVVPLPSLTTPIDFATCEDDLNNNGYYSYPLNTLIPGVLGTQNPSNFTVSFYENQMSAENNVNPISNLANYQTYTHSIWIRVSNVVTGCYKISSFNTIVEQKPQLVIVASTNIICVDYLTNQVLGSATLTATNTTSYLSQSSPTYGYQWYLNGMAIAGATGPTYTVNAPLFGASAGFFSVRMTSSSILGCSAVSSEYQVNQSGPATPIGIGYSIVNNSGNQTLTVEVSGYGTYEYQLDTSPRQTNSIFTNVSLGNHILTVYDTQGGLTNSCNPLVLNNINVNLTATPPPTGNSLQIFNQGATLANMQVAGQYIQWYSGANKNAAALQLPLNTVLVNGTTYFASQKIGGYESTTRLPVTVQLNLSNSQFELKGVSYAPNPVEVNLSVKSDDVIEDVSIYNLLGQLVLTQKCNTTNLQIDVTSLNSGNYFVKLTSQNKQSTIKIEKK